MKDSDFQKTLKRMLESPPKENKPIGKKGLTKSPKKKKQAAVPQRTKRPETKVSLLTFFHRLNNVRCLAALRGFN